ncbi:MAG: hypothetical protein KDA57_19490 [Planctomycetales bacterium]|nr:hypothetical protein [Planctomycetales bacterium]
MADDKRDDELQAAGKQIVVVVLVLIAIVSVFGLLRAGYLQPIGQAIVDWAFGQMGAK